MNALKKNLKFFLKLQKKIKKKKDVNKDFFMIILVKEVENINTIIKIVYNESI